MSTFVFHGLLYNVAAAAAGRPAGTGGVIILSLHIGKVKVRRTDITLWSTAPATWESEFSIKNYNVNGLKYFVCESRVLLWRGKE